MTENEQGLIVLGSEDDIQESELDRENQLIAALITENPDLALRIAANIHQEFLIARILQRTGKPEYKARAQKILEQGFETSRIIMDENLLPENYLTARWILQHLAPIWTSYLTARWQKTRVSHDEFIGLRNRVQQVKDWEKKYNLWVEMASLDSNLHIINTARLRAQGLQGLEPLLHYLTKNIGPFKKMIDEANNHLGGSLLGTPEPEKFIVAQLRARERCYNLAAMATYACLLQHLTGGGRRARKYFDLASEYLEEPDRLLALRASSDSYLASRVAAMKPSYSMYLSTIDILLQLTSKNIPENLTESFGEFSALFSEYTRIIDTAPNPPEEEIPLNKYLDAETHIRICLFSKAAALIRERFRRNGIQPPKDYISAEKELVTKMLKRAGGVKPAKIDKDYLESVAFEMLNKAWQIAEESGDVDDQVEVLFTRAILVKL